MITRTERAVQPPACRDEEHPHRNAILRSLRRLGHRGFLLTQPWRAPHHVTPSPSKIGDIARAALVLTHFEHGYITHKSRRDPSRYGTRAMPHS